MKELLNLLAQLPPDKYVKFCVEGDRLIMYYFTEAPEEGWVTEGDYFGSPKDAEKHRVPCRQSWKFLDRVEFAVCSDMNDFPKRIMESLEERIRRYK